MCVCVFFFINFVNIFINEHVLYPVLTKTLYWYPISRWLCLLLLCCRKMWGNHRSRTSLNSGRIFFTVWKFHYFSRGIWTFIGSPINFTTIIFPLQMFRPDSTKSCRLLVWDGRVLLWQNVYWFSKTCNSRILSVSKVTWLTSISGLFCLT